MSKPVLTSAEGLMCSHLDPFPSDFDAFWSAVTIDLTCDTELKAPNENWAVIAC